MDPFEKRLITILSPSQYKHIPLGKETSFTGFGAIPRHRMIQVMSSLLNAGLVEKRRQKIASENAYRMHYRLTSDGALLRTQIIDEEVDNLLNQ